MELKQDQQYQGADRWKWSIWVEGTNEELNSIASVEYTLHPTFSNPVQLRTDRDSKFRLATSGWGTFTIYAKIKKTNDEEIDVEHELELYYPEELDELDDSELDEPEPDEPKEPDEPAADSGSDSSRFREKRLASIREFLKSSEVPDPVSIARETVIKDRIDQILRNPRFKWRTLERVAIETGVSEAEAADKLRADDSVRFGRSKKGETIVGLKKIVGDSSTE